MKVLKLAAGAAMVSMACAAMAHDQDGDDAANAALVAARQKIFGAENVDGRGRVDKDKVIFSWAANTTYVASVLGRVVVFDSYLTKPELPTAPIDRRYDKLLPKDLADAKPEAIFLGHGHGDHADNAAYIAKWSGATIYASAETCQVMQLDVQRMWNDPNAVNGGAKIVPDGNPVKCVDVVPAGSYPGQYDPTTGRSKATRLRALDPQACILAFKFIHSGTAPIDSSFPHTTLFDLADPRYAGRTITTPPPAVTYPAMFPNGTSFTPSNPPVPGQMDTRTTGFGSPPGIPGGSITILYQFVLRGDNNFSFVWLNSAGPATEGIGADPGLVTLSQYNDPTTPPDKLALARNIGQSLYDLMDTLPSTDVLLGSIVSLGAANNQQRDIIKVTQHLRPKVYYPGHITDVAQKGSGIYHKIAWEETALNMGFAQKDWPEFRLLIDPNDFLRPQVFDPKSERWSERGKSSRMPDGCR
ncbi:MAG TPA: MBL fold metallo-hydrolase [Burkholderiales bacterium]|jgi:L-ascorbate metabolism protein UlaG (beta-lactamase superfamily)|nr:MBL fold metallo-hydrolase [Burkholderiales bacterium]